MIAWGQFRELSLGPSLHATILAGGPLRALVRSILDREGLTCRSHRLSLLTAVS
jgi:hypothetical protein